MRRLTPLSSLLLAAPLLSAGLPSCGEPPPPPIELVSTENIDMEVLNLILGTLRRLEAAPENTDLRVELALVYEANQLWHEANLAWAQAIILKEQQGVDQGPRGRGVHVYHQALCARQSGAVAKAAELLRQAVAIAPNLPAAHHELAESHLEVGELADAAAHFKAAARLAPRSSDPLVGLALVHLGREEAPEAEVQARKALAIEPELKRAHYALGLALRGQGRLDDAEREMTLGVGGKARNLGDPLSARLQGLKTGYHTRISEAVSHISAGNPAAALRLMEPILATHPDDVALLNNLAVAYTHLGQHEKARRVLLDVIAQEPKSFPAYINLTASELELGMNAEALQHAESAVRYAPDVAKTRFVRARAYMRYQRWNEAHADLKKAVQIQGDDALHHTFLGEVSQELGLHLEAIREFETALRLDTGANYIWLELGFSAAIIGDFQKAAEAYQKAQRYSGTNNPRVQALGRLISGG